MSIPVDGYDNHGHIQIKRIDEDGNVFIETYGWSCFFSKVLVKRIIKQLLLASTKRRTRKHVRAKSIHKA